MWENIRGPMVIYAIANCLWNPDRERSCKIQYILVTHKIGPNLLPPPNYCLEISQNSVIQSTHCKCLLCTSTYCNWCKYAIKQCSVTYRELISEIQQLQFEQMWNSFTFSWSIPSIFSICACSNISTSKIQS